MEKKFYLLIAVSLLCCLYLTCNIFNPSEKRDPEDRGAHALVLEGKIKMQEGKWEEALVFFDQAAAEDSSLSEALFYKGKCILRIAGVDLEEVWGEINPAREDTLAVPFLFRGWDTLGIKLTSPTTKPTDIPSYLDDSISNPIQLIDSVFLERKILYDAICQAVKGLEKIHYDAENMDGLITRATYESDFLIELSVKAILGLIDVNSNDTLDWDSTTGERDAFRIFVQDIPSLDQDSMIFDSLKTISKDPKDINGKLDSLLATITKADTSYLNFKGELLQSSEKTDQLDTGMVNPLGEMIQTFKTMLPYFYYNEHTDNDSDYYDTDSNNIMTRMIWIDWDHDSLIDVNGPTGPHLHIGDKAHRDANQSFYTDVGDDKYDRYKYSGPHTYEFIHGDWGVDEEIMDGADNDQDGLTDEDTRIVADTLDDDGDWHDTDPATTLNDDSYDPMGWAGADNIKIDIGGAVSDWDQVVIDPLFVATHTDHQPSIPATIPRYKGVYTGEFTSGDYGMDEEWFDGLDNDGDGLIDEDVGKSIPNSSLRQEIIDSLRALR